MSDIRQKNGVRLLVAMTVVSSLAIGVACNAQQPTAKRPTASRAQSEAQTRPNFERQRQDAARQAERTLDREAIVAVDETRKAVKAIADKRNSEALAAIERATGKINILLARNPATALLPVEAGVVVIDLAPSDTHAIHQRAAAAQRAVNDKDYPRARVLLDGLTSEIRVRTYHLPLATYPEAMKEAARLLDQKKPQEASAVLQTALNTLVIIDRSTPLPLTLARAAIDSAQAEKNRSEAQQLLTIARNELARAKALGYAGTDPEYAGLDSSIADLEQQLKGNQNTASAFARLKEQMAAFFKRLSESTRTSNSTTR